MHARLLAAALAAALAGSIGAAAYAGDALPTPPFQMVKCKHVVVGVVWDEAAVRAALPEGIEPVNDMTGGINIYQTGGDYGIAPYKAVYFWVDIKGFDSADGTKGRWMLAGAYGPDDKTHMANKAFYGWPVRNGVSRFEDTAGGKRAIGTVGGADVVLAEIRSSDECEAIAGTLNYPGQLETSGQIVITQIPYAGDWCPAEPVSVEVTAPAGDPFAKFKPAKVVWAGEFRDGAFSFSRPLPAP